MLGGIASSVHRLSVRRGGTTTQVVLKRFTDPAWGDAGDVVNEASALAAAGALGVPAPRLLGASPDGADTDGVPSLLMARAPGRAWLTPDDADAWVRQLATVVPVIHAGRAEVQQHRPEDLERVTVPASARQPELWSAAIRALAGGPPPPGDPVFLHGDYQHFNVLWTRGRLSALVAWALSRVGPPDVDVCHCRLNLAVLYSAELAERFRHAYESEAGRRVEPWWDVRQLLVYGDSWQRFIPQQVAGRAPVDVPGMTGRVEDLLALALARL